MFRVSNLRKQITQIIITYEVKQMYGFDKELNTLKDKGKLFITPMFSEVKCCTGSKSCHFVTVRQFTLIISIVLLGFYAAFNIISVIS